MNATSIYRFKHLVFSGLLLLCTQCERVVDGLEPPPLSNNPEVFLDGFSGGLNYAAFGGSVPAAFQVDNEVTYNNTAASMRFEVPDANDPRGAYAGGVFYTTVGRNLTEYDALTFWIKATQPATIDILGFGNDLGASTYQVSVSDLRVNTNWKKIVIPIPDPSKLDAERGMFFYSEGPEDNKGYTFWIDELKFEKLGTVAHPQFAILSGQAQVETSYAGVTRTIGGLTSIYNMPDGVNRAVSITPAYFEFTSSDESIATVNASGVVSVVGGPGTAVITANLGPVEANGSLTIQSQGVYINAPTPTHPAADVISIFSDAYNNVPVDYYNGFWAPFQTTLSEDFTVNGDNVLHYTNFNFVGIQMSSPPIDATAMTHLRLDIFLPNALAFGSVFTITIRDFGADGSFDGGDDSSGSRSFFNPILGIKPWVSLDIPFTDFTGLTGRSNIGQIVFEGTNITNFYADNIYFRR